MTHIAEPIGPRSVISGSPVSTDVFSTPVVISKIQEK
jgi:hypothetical protein